MPQVNCREHFIFAPELLMSRKLTSLVLHSDCRVICLSHNHLCARYLNTPIFSFGAISDEPG